MADDFASGQLAVVAFNSWAGREEHLVKILKVCPKRLLVRWHADDCRRFRHGGTYYIPKYAVRALAPSSGREDV